MTKQGIHVFINTGNEATNCVCYL